MRENKEGGYYVLRVDAVTPSAVRPLALVRGDVSAAWRAKQIGDRLDQLAGDLLKQAQAGKSSRRLPNR